MVRPTVGVAGVCHPNLDTLPTHVIYVFCASLSANGCHFLTSAFRLCLAVVMRAQFLYVIYVNLCFRELMQVPDPLNLLNALNEFGDGADSQ